MAEVSIELSLTYTAIVHAGRHQIVVDEPVSNGGHDDGPSPEQLLLSSLGCCMAITIRMVADRKGWPLEKVEVQLNFHRGQGQKAKISSEVKLFGPLEPPMRDRLMDIARKCPMHRTLTEGVDIEVVPSGQ